MSITNELRAALRAADRGARHAWASAHPIEGGCAAVNRGQRCGKAGCPYPSHMGGIAPGGRLYDCAVAVLGIEKVQGIVRGAAPGVEPEETETEVEAEWTEEAEPKAKPEAPKASQGATGDAYAVAEALRRLVEGGASVAALRAVEGRIAALESRAAVARVIELREPGKEARKIEGASHAMLPRVIRKIRANVPVLLVGPTGSGKSHLARQAAEALGLPFYFTSLTAGCSEGVLTGRLLPIGEGGRFAYVVSDFVRAYETGGVFCADELDAADPNVLLVVNSAIANGHMSLPNRPDSPVAHRHEAFRLAATANTFGHGADRSFVGRAALDAATLNRFSLGQIFVDYDPALEESIVPGPILAWGRRVRDAIRQHGFRRFCSTRNLLDAAKCEGAGDSPAEWRADYFADWKPDELAALPRDVKP